MSAYDHTTLREQLGRGLLTKAQAATRLGVDVAKVEKFITSGRLRTIDGYVTERSVRGFEADHPMKSTAEIAAKALTRYRKDSEHFEEVAIPLDGEKAGGFMVWGTLLVYVEVQWSPRGNMPERPSHEGWIARGIDDVFLSETSVVSGGRLVESLPTPHRQGILAALVQRYEEQACDTAIEQRKQSGI